MDSPALPTPVDSSPSFTRIMLRIALGLAIVVAIRFLYLLGDDVQAADFTHVDTSKVSLLSGATWADPRWENEIRAKLAALGPIGSEDEVGLARAVHELESLSFVAELSEPAVIWPDGLRFDARLRVPIACVRSGDEFQTVSADGTLLSGRWPAPPERNGGYLPVVVVGASTERLHPGPVVWPDVATDGLAVAQSLWASLDPASLAKLGRVVIDAREARTATVENGGVVILMEQGRRVFFGRAPNTDEPGELPVEQKWKGLQRALRYLEPIGENGPPEFDWELVDVRWDVPELVPRGGFPKDDPRSKPRAQARKE
jgi:hypothetical protein